MNRFDVYKKDIPYEVGYISKIEYGNYIADIFEYNNRLLGSIDTRGNIYNDRNQLIGYFSFLDNAIYDQNNKILGYAKDNLITTLDYYELGNVHGNFTKELEPAIGAAGLLLDIF